MHIHLINPNSTASMTAQALESALLVKHAHTHVSASNPTDTPASIEGGADEAMSVPGMLAEIRQGEAQGVDAYVIACFDDPGLHAAREVAKGPVIGICQAAVQVAMTISRRFSVITTLPRSVPIIEDLVSDYGAERHCRKVRAIDLPVLALEEDPQRAERLLLKEIEIAMAEDGAEAIVLGCAGMSSLCDRLQKATGVPVIDGVTAAVKMAEALLGAGYATSKVNTYAYPRIKAAAGHKVCA
ncbi:aspartate/glutamate racemase family protein [Sinorhizobium meliloti]|uniref:aspartate/glutamate racemase family protein n=1 Tax=Rhizobium meliloti TaxID=382 RepID=UPI0001E4BC7C|nr:aspartate/glutamate racemase family protein [Sinorhizobium meliloti]AEG05329.1 Hydantoin racemase [Sinorhizobium meliloti BL225C]ASP72602.1 aspartate/glutamate racemase family protein [Sinorhizobium meliloti]MDE3830122.1 aspartate/glutamate racemase family protein [Sinorhizobium meliloti]MDE3853659.1 aspartate/glutamate racemase family protein [Sinorhizobium meliloti]MDE4546274.1 aspartate/glutamate racemase family protein [Sinorhizobium meliloti]